MFYCPRNKYQHQHLICPISIPPIFYYLKILPVRYEDEILFLQKIKKPHQVVKLCVTHTGQFSNHLLEQFRKIYELKAVIPVQMLQPAIQPKRLKVA